MAFNWTPLRLARLASAVRSYNGAISRREKEIMRSALSDGEKSALVKGLPKKTSTTEVRGRISDRNDYRRIVGEGQRGSELRRVLKKYNPKALEPAEGSFVSNYIHNENRLMKRREVRAMTQTQREAYEAERKLREDSRRQRKLMETELFPGDMAYDFDSMTPSEYAESIVNTEIDQEIGEPDEDYVEDSYKYDAQSWRQEDARRRAASNLVREMKDNWLNVWKDPRSYHSSQQGYDDVIDAVEWMELERPDVLEKLFLSKADEVQIDFIYFEPRKVPAYMSIPPDVRHNRVVHMITSVARSAGWRG